MGYFVVSGLLSEYFIQAYLVGGFLLIPFQILALIAATLVGSKVRKLIGSNSDPRIHIWSPPVLQGLSSR